MTNEQVRDGFNEVYNQFWNKYKNNVPDKDSEEWERIRTWVTVIGKKYPFLSQTITDLEVELDKRMRRGDKNGSLPGSINRQIRAPYSSGGQPL